MDAFKIALIVLLSSGAAVAQAAPDTPAKHPVKRERFLHSERAADAHVSKPLCGIDQRKALVSASQGISEVALNPQPLPPSPADRVSEVALNPQPLPPSPADRGSEVALNPQPLPPSPADRVSEVALNPQPLPPSPADRIAGAGATASNLIPPDPIKPVRPNPPDPVREVALNPQPLPPVAVTPECVQPVAKLRH